MEDLSFLYAARDEERKLMPIYPFQGVYGLETDEQRKEAIKLMSHGLKIDHTHSIDPYSENKGKPIYILSYYCNSLTILESMTEAVFHQYEGSSVIRKHKDHINLFWSPVHNNRLGTLNQIRKAYVAKIKAKEKKDALIKKKFDALPKEITIEFDVYEEVDHHETYQLPNGCLALKPAKVMAPCGKRDIRTEKFLTAVRTEHCKERSGYDKTLIVTKDAEGKVKTYTESPKYEEFGNKSFSSYSCYEGEEMVWKTQNLTPGDSYDDYEPSYFSQPSTITITKLTAKQIKSMLDKGILKVREHLWKK